MKLKLAVALLGAGSVFGLPAFADVTAREVADRFQELANSVGVTVDYAAERTGPGSLILEDVRITFPQTEIPMVFEPEWLRFTETGDGAVVITVPEEIPINEVAEADSNYSGTASGRLVSTGYETTVEKNSGSWAVSDLADNILFAMEDNLFSFSVEQDGIAHEVRFSDGEAAWASTFGKAAALKISGTDRLDDTKFETELENLRWTGELSGALPELGLSDFGIHPDLLRISFDGLKHFERPLSQGPAGLAYLSKAGEFSFRRVSAQVTEVNFKLSESEFMNGEVVGFGIGTIDISTRFLESSDEADDEFDVDISLDDIALRDAFFDLLDGSGKLMRDPGRFRADAVINFRKGWLEELFEASEDSDGTEVQDINRLLVQEISANWAGAAIDIDGEMRFAAAPSAEGGMTAVPVGALNVELNGVLALLDTFVEAGAFNAADAAGLRVLIAGMGEKAAGREDSYLFHLEFQPDGQMLMNGNPSPF